MKIEMPGKFTLNVIVDMQVVINPVCIVSFENIKIAALPPVARNDSLAVS
jgi:hypothetical protein